MSSSSVRHSLEEDFERLERFRIIKAGRWSESGSTHTGLGRAEPQTHLIKNNIINTERQCTIISRCSEHKKKKGRKKGYEWNFE